jgi:hypothetical protein
MGSLDGGVDMRRLGFLTAALLLSAARVFAGGDEIVLKGEVVDVTCYSKQGVAKGTGASHVSCAMDCAKKGKPLGLLTDGDGLFKFVGDYTENNSAKLLPFIGKQVEVRGTTDRFTDYTIAIRPVKITLVK